MGRDALSPHCTFGTAAVCHRDELLSKPIVKDKFLLDVLSQALPCSCPPACPCHIAAADATCVRLPARNTT